MEARKTGKCESSLAAVTPETAAQEVARMEVPTMAVGLVEPFAARMAIAVAGISWIELVLIARKVHMALVAVPGWGFSVSKSSIARKPSGVAALPNPRIPAAMLRTMEPMAG